jgi:hypothetical protein
VLVQDMCNASNNMICGSFKELAGYIVDGKDGVG